MAGFTSVTMSGTMKESIELQKAELEMLFSMFPNKGEITLQDENCFLNVQKYLSNTSEDLPHKIEYSVAVTIDEPKVRPSVLHWDVFFALSSRILVSLKLKIHSNIYTCKSTNLREYTILCIYNHICVLIFRSRFQKHE